VALQALPTAQSPDVKHEGERAAQAPDVQVPDEQSLPLTQVAPVGRAERPDREHTLFWHVAGERHSLPDAVHAQPTSA
jgi:hypothetical protein